ncbi:zf-TFIIB domain-containing protein [Brevundimonas sp.]|uniref:TFIIB-type zinc ribbon-containing protein n=1 Tax=Brevundimonas sp. TaxID=1871086 RepID=UPI003F70E169
MPLLLCPNDNASMTTVNRSGVEFDMCPTCRGVWLDRGELEKLIEAGGGQGGASPASAAYGMPSLGRDYGRDRDDDYNRDGGYRKKKRRDIFDIFD